MGTDHIEKAILGYMIIDNSLDSKLLNVKHFTGTQNKTIYKAIRNLKKEGKTTDLTVVTQYLDDSGLLASGMKTGVEASYLSSLWDGLVLGSAAEHHFKIHVNELITAYRQKEIEKLIAKAAKEPDFLPDVKKIIDGHELESIEPIESLTVAANVGKLEEFIEKRRAGEFWGFNITCFPRLTRDLMGLREISILIADEKIGKSTLVLQIAADIAGQGYPVIYYDFENGRENLMARLLCQRSNIAYGDELFKRGDELGAEIKGGFISLENHFKNFAIITDRKLSIDKIRSQVFQMKQRAGQERSLVVIDSLQKLPMKDLGDRRAAVDRWLRDFEELRAEDPNLTILMVSEVSREKKLPKESGDIEYTAHFLLRLRKNQEKEKDGDPEPPDDMKRRLFLERARDVESNKLIGVYEAKFKYWKFEESSGDW